MLKTESSGEAFFSLIKKNFERSMLSGTVQVISENPALNFFVNVGSSLSYFEGNTPNPTATIVMDDGILIDLVTERYHYDPRLVEFSSRLKLSGNIKLAITVLDLVKSPSPETEALLATAKKVLIEKPVTRVERINKPDKNFIKQAMQDFRPVLMTGLLDDWKVSQWTPSALKANFGRFKISSYLPETINDFIDAMISPPQNRDCDEPQPYTNGVGLPGILWKYFPEPDALKNIESLGFPQLWLGTSKSPREAITNLHCDCMHGFLCHVFGSKTFILYSPDQDDFVYPHRSYNQFRSCWTRPEKPDYETYPLFSRAMPLEVIVNPGDVLFVPSGWFHCVYAPGPVMSITFPVDG